MESTSNTGTFEQQRKILECFWCASLDALDLAIDHIAQEAQVHVLPSKHEFVAFFATLPPSRIVDLKRGCLLLYLLSSGCIEPQLFQLEISLALLSCQDCILNSGTGSGKTLTIILPLLMRRHSTSITVSPFKQLQTSQNEEMARYGLRSVVINEDTSDDPALWKAIEDGYYEHIIISPEQLDRYHGHFTRFSVLMKSNKFRDRVSFVNIDEAHEIYLSGQPRDGTPAFRPAYAKLDVLRLKFKKTVPFLALSATLPPHITDAVKRTLLLGPNTLEKRLCLNRPNITYATRAIVSGCREYRNLSFLIPSSTKAGNVQKTIVFFDNSYEAHGACEFLRQRFAALETSDSGTEELLGAIAARNLVEVFHSDMSKGYLQTTHKSFDSSDGKCKILCATACAATGLDFQGVINVIQYGTCRDLCSLIQRTGRAFRDGGTCGLFLYLFEPWAVNLEVDTKSERYGLDPDLPLTPPSISKTSNKCDHISQASVGYITSPNCLRKYVADYLDDEFPNALEFVANVCCDRHGVVDFSQFFPGEFFAGDLPKESTATRVKHPPAKEDDRLSDLLVQWRQDTLAKHPYRAILSVSDILDNTSIISLSKALPEHMNNKAAITMIIGETEEWALAYAGQVFVIIADYNMEIKSRALYSKAAKQAARQCSRGLELVQKVTNE